jgi:predicted NBD/HSP70 family sugar kinase
VGSAGQNDHGRGTVIYADENLPGWTGMALRTRLEAALALPVAMDNDVHAMALAEATYGAAAGRRVALVVAVGTGVGGALVLGGHLFRLREGPRGCRTRVHCFGGWPMETGRNRCGFWFKKSTVAGGRVTVNEA